MFPIFLSWFRFQHYKPLMLFSSLFPFHESDNFYQLIPENYLLTMFMHSLYIHYRFFIFPLSSNAPLLVSLPMLQTLNLVFFSFHDSSFHFFFRIHLSVYVPIRVPFHLSLSIPASLSSRFDTPFSNSPLASPPLLSLPRRRAPSRHADERRQDVGGT